MRILNCFRVEDYIYVFDLKIIVCGFLVMAWCELSVCVGGGWHAINYLIFFPFPSPELFCFGKEEWVFPE